MLVNFHENGNITNSISWFLLNASTFSFVYVRNERQLFKDRTPGEDNSIFNSIYISGKLKQKKYSDLKKWHFSSTE